MVHEGVLDQEPGDHFSSELYPNEPCDLGQAFHSLDLCFSVCQGGSWLRTLLRFILPGFSELEMDRLGAGVFPGSARSRVSVTSPVGA